MCAHYTVCVYYKQETLKPNKHIPPNCLPLLYQVFYVCHLMSCQFKSKSQSKFLVWCAESTQQWHKEGRTCLHTRARKIYQKLCISLNCITPFLYLPLSHKNVLDFNYLILIYRSFAIINMCQGKSQIGYKFFTFFQQPKFLVNKFQ